MDGTETQPDLNGLGGQQIDAGQEGFRAYILEFLGPVSSTPRPSDWKAFGYVLSAGEGMTQNHVGPNAYPRLYQWGREYWRTFDTGVTDLFAARDAGTLQAMRLRLVEKADWWGHDLPTKSAWVRTTFEGTTQRKRECLAHPPWPPQGSVPQALSDEILFEGNVSGDPMVIRFRRDPQTPCCLSHASWFHARPTQGLSPVFFGNQQLGGQGQAFLLIPGPLQPPAQRTAFYTAQTPLVALPGDP